MSWPYMLNYDLLSFCAKSCAKTAEAEGELDFRTSKERKQDNAAPAWNLLLALMQTVVMSFARGLYLGKSELPIDHVHTSTIWTMLPTTLRSLWGSLKENAHMNNIPQSRPPQPWRERVKKGCLIRVLDRLAPLPPLTKQAFRVEVRCGTSSRREELPYRSLSRQCLTTVLPESPQQIRDLAR